MVGSRPSGSFNGLKVLGQHGYALIVSDTLVPAGYLTCVATGDSNSDRNPIALREHANAGLQGLRLIKGTVPDYPLIESYYNRGFGVLQPRLRRRSRHRGAAACMQVTTNASYTAPTF